MQIQTSRLRLVPATAALVGLEISSPEAFGNALGATIPANWPPEMLVDALPWFLQQLTTAPQLTGWLGWYGLREPGETDTPVLMASAGFLGRPENGTVEIGYSVLPQFQGQGYATEMAAALVNWAFSQPSVQRVIAEVSDENKPSLRVLEKLNFVPVGAGREKGHREWERTSRVPSA